MGANQHRLDRIEQGARAAITQVADAMPVVLSPSGTAEGREVWFHRRRDRRWLSRLSFYRRTCVQIGEVDLRRLDRRPGATIKSLILMLFYRRCRLNPPFVKLLGLAKLLSTDDRSCSRGR